MRLEEQEMRLGEQQKEIRKLEKKIEKLENELEEQKNKIEEQEMKMEELEKKLQGKNEPNRSPHESETTQIVNWLKTAVLKIKLKMKNFSLEKAKDQPYTWMSPTMHTHVNGYKFCIGVDANGYGDARGNFVSVAQWVMPGEFDNELKWPAMAKFIIELINTHKVENASSSITNMWEKPGQLTAIEYIPKFVSQDNIKNYLVNDSLYFTVSFIEFL